MGTAHPTFGTEVLLGHAIADPLLVASARGDDFNGNDLRLVVVVLLADHCFDLGVLLLGCFDRTGPFFGRFGFAFPSVQARDGPRDLATRSKSTFNQVRRDGVEFVMIVAGC